MSRSIAEIYAALVAEKQSAEHLSGLAPEMDNAQTLLSDLTSQSRVARWRLFLFVVATGIWTLEKLWDQFREEVDAIAAGSTLGTLPWYVERIRAFQYGHDLELINGTYGYAEDDATARIVARAAGVEAGGVIILKTARLVDGQTEALSTLQREALETYVNAIKMAGSVVNLVSQDADLLRLTMTVYYDPLVMSPDGSLILEDSVYPVHDAVSEYLSALPFNAQLRRTAIVDAVQQAMGVKDVIVDNAEARYGFLPFSAWPVSYIPVAGHIKIDPAFPLDSTITYLPYV